MKLLATMTALIILVISAGFWTNHQLQKATNNLIQQIDLVGVQIKANNWPEAVEQAEILEDDWKTEAKWWPVFLEHQEMDNIEFSMAKFMEYVSSRNNSLSLGQLSEIRLMLEHIPRKEEVNLKNIL